MLSLDDDALTTIEDSPAGVALLDLLLELEIQESSDAFTEQAA
jgi:hypothetical protein